MKNKTDWYSNYSMLALGVVLLALVVIYLCRDLEISGLLPYLFGGFTILLFVISFAVAIYRKKRQMENDPVKMLGFMVMLLSVLLLVAIFDRSSDNQKDSTLLLCVLFLQMSMLYVYMAVKHQQKRITALEEKLKDQQRLA